ncbi:hypothetical protein [Listeria ilorinensis]|uniref:hypothetical protein n=1 Tax=Listeria ilorinensis TaxID=2867439 RepID=UPI001EF6A83B|nr:hypothetical protein [Listeria ilorinensis]
MEVFTLKKKSTYPVIVTVILTLAVLFALVQMFTDRIVLPFSLLWHWIFIISFAVTTGINAYQKRLIGTAIGLSGLVICISSLVIQAYL